MGINSPLSFLRPNAEYASAVGSAIEKLRANTNDKSNVAGTLSKKNLDDVQNNAAFTADEKEFFKDVSNHFDEMDNIVFGGDKDQLVSAYDIFKFNKKVDMPA